jgi:hypothetical protein
MLMANGTNDGDESSGCATAGALVESIITRASKTSIRSSGGKLWSGAGYSLRWLLPSRVLSSVP